MADEGAGAGVSDLDMGRLPPRHRFDVWSKLLEPVFQPTLADRERVDRFHCDVAIAPMAEAVVMRCAASEQRFERSIRDIRQTGWDYVMVQLYTSGGFHGDAQGRPIKVGTGDINVFDLSKTLHTAASDFSNVTLVLPREYFGDVSRLHGGVLRATSSMSSVVKSHMLALAGNGAGLDADEAKAALGALSLMITGSTLKEGGRDVQAAGAASLRDVVADYVATHIADPALDVDRILAECRIARATLYRLFAADNGIIRYIMNQRLDLALRLLVHAQGTPQRIGQIAFQCGFASETYFSRAFRQRFGVTPRDAREIGSASSLGDRYMSPVSWIHAMRRYRDEL